MPRDAVKRVVALWLEKAESDLRATRILLAADDCPYDVVCFHAQQSAEKAVKALLVCHEISFGKTHDLLELVSKLPEGYRVGAQLDDLDALTDAAVEPRYPSETRSDSAEVADSLVAYAQSVMAAVIVDLRACECME